MREVRVLFGTTFPGGERLCTDLLWRTKFEVGDPVYFCEFDDGEAVLIVSDLEYERAKKEAKNCRVELESSFASRAEPQSLIGGIIEFFKERGVGRIVVPDSLSITDFKKFLDFGFEVEALGSGELFYPQRIIKSPEEIAYIAGLQRKTEEVVWRVVEILRDATVNKEGILVGRNSEIITAERIRDFMEMEFMKQRCLAVHTIVACGDQVVDPHAKGSGPLYAHVPIVMDVYPRSTENWYWADMTRTFFKGEPTEKARTMYETVLAAQRMAIGMVRAGVDGLSINGAVVELFEKCSYRTGIQDGTMQGFFHGVGHGVGLELHEWPAIHAYSNILPERSVVTVEPGLYYIGVGGVRIEDLVVVEKDGCRNLTLFPKELNDMIIP